MILKSGQQVTLLFDKEATGTISRVHDGTVFVTWNHDKPGASRVRHSYPEDEAQRVLVTPRRD